MARTIRLGSQHRRRARQRARTRSLLSAYRYFRSLGLSPSDAVRCARAEVWAFHAGAQAFVVVEYDDCEQEQVLAAHAGFVNGHRDEFHQLAPRVCVMHCANTNERWARAESLHVLRVETTHPHSRIPF